MTDARRGAVEASQRRAGEHLAQGNWRAALAEYAAIVRAQPHHTAPVRKDWVEDVDWTALAGGATVAPVQDGPGRGARGVDPATVAGVGMARALARGGHHAEAHRVLSRVLDLHSYAAHERRTVLEAVQAEAGPPAVPGVDPSADDTAAAVGLLVWRPAAWPGAYVALLLALSGLPLLLGVLQRHYPSVVFGALSGGAVLACYVVRHRRPFWY